MGEIRFVGTGETRGYPYLVCKKRFIDMDETCGYPYRVCRKTRIYHWSPMQTEKSEPEGSRMMSKTRFTEFPASSVDSRVGISWSASETDDSLFFLPIIGKIEALKKHLQ